MKEIIVKIDLSDLEKSLIERLDRIEAKLNEEPKPIPIPQPIPVPTPTPSKPEKYLTLEDFGGDGYYKRIDQGLSYKGNVITSSNPIFTSQDLGKRFCGLFAHKNDSTPDFDLYYPNIIGSRYSNIIEVISPTQIKVDFTYNTGSNKGYIFHDNSDAYKLLMEKYIQDDSIGIYLYPNKTYVINSFTSYKLPTHKHFIIESSEKSYLKFGVEDYFKWVDKKYYNQSGHLFEIGVSDKDFRSKNIVFLPPHRRIAESELSGLTLFGGTGGNIGEQKRVIQVLGNTALDEMRSIGDKVTDELFCGIGLGFIFSGGTYTGDGSKITDDVDDYLIVHIKDYEHQGPSFADLKANHGGGLLLVAENVTTNFEDENKYAPTYVKMKGRFSKDYNGLPINDKTFYPEHLLQITSGNSWYQTVVDNATRGWNNSAHAIQIDRFVLWQPCGNYWKYLYETWFNKGTKTNWQVMPYKYDFFNAQKMMLNEIPRVGRKYWIGRKYNQEGRTIKENIPNKIKGTVNWSAVQGVNWDQARVPQNAIPIQLQPNDKFKIGSEVYTVISTDREVHPLFVSEVMYFGGHDSVVSYFPVYTLDKNLPDSLPLAFEVEIVESGLEAYLDGREFEFYSIYKSNRFLNGHTKDTKFGDANILNSNPFGHVSYNHSQVSIWAENWKHNGFYRQSENNYNNYPSFAITQGQTSALRRWANISTFINCSGFQGQFDPSFNYYIRDAVYQSIGKSRPDIENVRLYGCLDMNGLQNRNDNFVKNYKIEEKPDLPDRIAQRL